MQWKCKRFDIFGDTVEIVQPQGWIRKGKATETVNFLHISSCFARRSPSRMKNYGAFFLFEKLF